MSKRPQKVSKKMIRECVHVDEYCVHLNEKIETYLEDIDVDKDDFPWNKDCPSDHLPVMAMTPMGTIVTWNTLNKKFLKHMQATPKNDNQRLGNHPMANMDPAVQAARECKVVDIVVDAFNSQGNIIVCLQEVSFDLFQKLTAKFNDGRYSLILTRENQPSSGLPFTNCNLIMMARACYSVVGRGAAIPPVIEDGMQHKADCEFFTLQRMIDGVKFNVMSVHLPWGDKVDYPSLLLGLKTELVTVVAGYFNRGVRYPIAPDRAHMRVYSDDRFVFPNPTLALPPQPPYSHVGYYQNVGNDTYRMLERFDHVMMVLPHMRPAPDPAANEPPVKDEDKKIKLDNTLSESMVNEQV